MSHPNWHTSTQILIEALNFVEVVHIFFPLQTPLILHANAALSLDVSGVVFFLLRCALLFFFEYFYFFPSPFSCIQFCCMSLMQKHFLPYKPCKNLFLTLLTFTKVSLFLYFFRIMLLFLLKLLQGQQNGPN